MKKKYKITVNEVQAQLIVNALDMYARVGLGQIERIHDNMFHFNRSIDFHDLIPEFKKATTGFPYGASYGIYNKEAPESCRTGWDILQVIRYRLAWDKHPEGGHTVDFHKPMKAGKEPLPVIE